MAYQVGVGVHFDYAHRYGLANGRAMTERNAAMIGQKVEYFGSAIEAHGAGEILAVHGNGRVDIRVTELAFAHAPGPDGVWREVGSLLVRNVRAESFRAVSS